MSDLLQIAGVPEKSPDKPARPAPSTDGTLCARPGHNIVTHCIEAMNHEGQHTYSPVPDDVERMSDKLESVMRLLTLSCPDYMADDFVTPRPHCCGTHKAAATVMEAQKILRVIRR